MCDGSSQQNVFDVTLSLDGGNAYGSGDLLADTQEIADVFIDHGRAATLASVLVLDEDDNKSAFTLIFLNASTSIGTENSALNITDTLARNIVGWVDVGAGDYKDFGGASVAMPIFNPIVMKPAAGSLKLSVAAVNGTGTQTYTASGLKLKLGFLF